MKHIPDSDYHDVYREDFDSALEIERTLPVKQLRREADAPTKHGPTKQGKFSRRYKAGILGTVIGGASILMRATR